MSSPAPQDPHPQRRKSTWKSAFSLLQAFPLICHFWTDAEVATLGCGPTHPSQLGLISLVLLHADLNLRLGLRLLHAVVRSYIQSKYNIPAHTCTRLLITAIISIHMLRARFLHWLFSWSRCCCFACVLAVCGLFNFLC